MNCRINITEPVYKNSTVDYGASFRVEGTIETDFTLPEDTQLEILLRDKNKNIIRRVSQNKKNSRNVFAYHPDLTCYDEATDPGREKMIDYGFPELMVSDTEKPLESLRNAEIKCWFSDAVFRAVIVSGSDTHHGMVADDGINFVSASGEAYDMLPQGDYTIIVKLSDSKGNGIASAEKLIHIITQKDRLICRFNPLSHKNRIIEWAHKNNFAAIENSLPGYLNPYIGPWSKHMGLLTMYRANDMALFDNCTTHMFVYLDDPTSTSYETELAFLQSKGVVGNSNLFRSYYYDIGEAVAGAGRSFEKSGEIREFAPDEGLHIARIDIVNNNAEENIFNLDCTGVDDVMYNPGSVKIPAGSRFAVMGIVKPPAFDRKYFTLKKDNTYKIENRVENVVYTFTCDGVSIAVERKLMMERIDGHSIGKSVFEFYNIFETGSEFRGKKIKVTVNCTDLYGNTLPGSYELLLDII